MAKITFAQSPANAPRRAPRLVFRPADARRLFRRGDLAMCAGAIVVVCASERDEGDWCVSLDDLRTAHEGFFPNLMGPAAN